MGIIQKQITKGSTKESRGIELLNSYANEIIKSNGNEQEIENVIKNIIECIVKSQSYHVDFEKSCRVKNEEDWNAFIDSIHKIKHAIPQSMVEQRDFIQKLLEHKIHVIERESSQYRTVNMEIAKRAKKIKITDSIKEETYNRHMKPVHDYEIGYNNFLGAIDMSEKLDYKQLFTEMAAIEKAFSLAHIEAVQVGYRLC